jgi:hypothetical protein
MIPRLGHHLGRGSVAVTVHRRTGPVHRLAVHPGSATSIPPSNPAGFRSHRSPTPPCHFPRPSTNHSHHRISGNAFLTGSKIYLSTSGPAWRTVFWTRWSQYSQGLDRNFPSRRSVPNSSWKLRLTRWFRQHAPGRGPQLVCIPINILRRTGNRPP